MPGHTAFDGFAFPGAFLAQRRPRLRAHHRRRRPGGLPGLDDRRPGPGRFLHSARHVAAGPATAPLPADAPEPLHPDALLHHPRGFSRLDALQLGRGRDVGRGRRRIRETAGQPRLRPLPPGPRPRPHHAAVRHRRPPVLHDAVARQPLLLHPPGLRRLPRPPAPRSSPGSRTATPVPARTAVPTPPPNSKPSPRLSKTTSPPRAGPAPGTQSPPISSAPNTAASMSPRNPS